MQTATLSIRECLKRHWGYDDLRPLQQEAIEAVLAKRDSLVVLPTGGGKSLCYQLPAMLVEGIALVISPLLSLIKDQCDALQLNGISAATLNSTQTAAERRSQWRAVREGTIKLLYLAPESLMRADGTPNEDLLALIQEANVSFVAIDEAHCISQWGHEYRPSYRSLGNLRAWLPEASFHAFTATATEEVRGDIVDNLGLRNCQTLVGDFDRPNLTYRTAYRQDALKQIQEVLDRHSGEAGIIYALSRAEVERISEKLTRLGYRVRPYHAGLPPEVRRANQEAFIREDIDLIVATVAFGMGIDRSDVRFVLHANMPKSIENYQQEAGRAGRDGLPAECVLLYSTSDMMTWRSLQADRESEFGQAAIRRLQDMLTFCQTLTCRHRFLVQYFGQAYEGEQCGGCDFCLGEKVALDDSATLARSLLAGVKSLRQRFGGQYVAEVLHGAKTEKIQQNGHQELDCYGKLAQYDRKDLVNWLEQLVCQGFLERGEYNALYLTENGRDCLDGLGSPQLAQPRPPRSKKEKKERSNTTGAENELFEALRAWRRDTAKKRNVPPYTVFHDATLLELATVRPTEVDALSSIKGIGNSKAEKFGDEVVALIRAHEPKPRAGKGETRLETLLMARRGLSPAEIAQQRGLAESTIWGHLASLVQSGEISPELVLSPEHIALMARGFELLGIEAPLGAVFSIMPGSIEYGPLQCVRADLIRKELYAQPAAPELLERLENLLETESLSDFRSALVDEDPRVRCLAAHALYRSKREDAVPSILERLPIETHSRVRVALLRAIAHHQDEQVLSAVKRCAENWQRDSKAFALKILARMEAFSPSTPEPAQDGE